MSKTGHNLSMGRSTKTMYSLADAASGVCGFRLYSTKDGISLAVEWSHSLNMLDIDISMIYEDVCDELAVDDRCVDVVVSCDQTKLFIGFFVNLRNKTRYKIMDNMSTLYGMKGSALPDIVIAACVWQNLMDDGVRAILHINNQTASIQFDEWWDHGAGISLTAAPVLWLGGVLLFVLGVLFWYGQLPDLASEAGRTDVFCQYVLPIIYSDPADVPFCSG